MEEVKYLFRFSKFGLEFSGLNTFPQLFGLGFSITNFESDKSLVLELICISISFTYYPRLIL